MIAYCANEKPFVYAIFSDRDRDRAVAVLEKLNEEGVLFWFPRQFGDGARGDLAKLSGKRFVCASELNEGQYFDESLLNASQVANPSRSASCMGRNST